MRTNTRTSLAALACTAALVLTGCGGDAEGEESGGGSDDLTRATENPEETIYGYVQAMAEGDLEAACGFQIFRPDGEDMEALPGDYDETYTQECLTESEEDIADEFLAPGGDDFWKDAAEVPIEQYQVEQDSPTQMEVQIPGEWDSYPVANDFYELVQVDTDVVEYYEDPAWWVQ